MVVYYGLREELQECLKACKEPEESWTKFPLIKIKIPSDKKNECEKYNYTTTADLGGSEEELPMKRRPK
ncbi:hypothetical protein CHARACLAT_001619 [Characodon lateralis]|uniref:Uncharacterized protein n=1 Tax=Characodon lateralis TaxID=208331 RepID=A0ABU7EFJ7_9TELE|nr:hypothetical protein [Characodon lateralis]